MSITPEIYYGGANEVAVTNDIAIMPRLGRMKRFTSVGVGLNAFLPDALLLPLMPGGPVFYLANEDFGENLQVKDFGGNNVHLLLAGTQCVVALESNDTSNGIWHFFCFPSQGKNPITTGPTSLTLTSTNLDITVAAGTTTTTTKTFPATSTTEAPTVTYVQGGRRIWEKTPTPIFARERGLVLREASVPGWDSRKKGMVSVVIGTLNEGSDLEGTIKDLYAARPDELIVIDDNSIEPLYDRIVNVSGARETSLRVLRNQRRFGVGASRTIGCRMARSDAIIITDSHMRFPPDFIDRFMVHHRAYPNAVLTCVSESFTPGDGMFAPAADVTWTPSLGYTSQWCSIAETDELCIQVPGIMGACYLIPKHILEAIGGWAPGLFGWGLDEEYVSVRAWLMGYEVRTCLDVWAQHNYARGETSRSSADGLEVTEWELLYNRRVLNYVLHEDPDGNVRHMMREWGPNIGGPATVALEENTEELELARGVVQAGRLMDQNDLHHLLKAVKDKAQGVITGEVTNAT